MKHLRTNSGWARKKYSGSAHVERSGVGTRLLSQQEIERLQSHVDRTRRGEVERPIRLEAK